MSDVERHLVRWIDEEGEAIVLALGAAGRARRAGPPVVGVHVRACSGDQAR